MTHSIGDRTRVEMTLNDLDELRAQVRNAVERANKLEAEMQSTLSAKQGEFTCLLMNIITAAVPIVQYAVANLDPQLFRHFPHKDLTHFGTLLQQLPTGLSVVQGVSQFTVELGQELVAAANDIAREERERVQRDRLNGVPVHTQTAESIQDYINPRDDIRACDIRDS